MEQQKPQPNQEYAKYEGQTSYAPTPPPTPQYGQVQPYTSTPVAYPPVAYRRDRGPVLPILFVAALVVAMLIIALLFGIFSPSQSYSQSVPIANAAAVTVHIDAGSVDLQLNLSGDKGSNANFSASGLSSFDLKPGDSDISLNVNAGNGFPFGGDSKVQVTLPPNVNLDLKTGSGDIKVSGIAGSVKVQTSSGDVNLAGASGDDLTVQTSSGDIHIGNAQPKQTLDLHSGSGDIEYGGDLANTSNAQAGNGDITLHISAAANFHATVDTNNGNISNDYNLAGNDKHKEGTTGSSGGANLPTLTVKTDNGDIEILKGR